MIAEIMKYLVISGFIIGFSFLIRNSMVNHFPLRLHRGFSSAKAVDLLEISEELEVPVEKERAVSDCWLVHNAIKSRYRKLVDDGLLHTLLTVRDRDQKGPAEVVGSSLDPALKEAH